MRILLIGIGPNGLKNLEGVQNIQIVMGQEIWSYKYVHNNIIRYNVYFERGI